MDGNEIADGNRQPSGRRRQVRWDFGEELRRRRVAAGLSLSELALRVHYSRGHLSRVETGRSPASRDLVRLCDTALGAGGGLVSYAVTASASRPAPGTSATKSTLSDRVVGPLSPPIGPASDEPTATGVTFPTTPLQSLPSQVSYVQAESVIDTFEAWFDMCRTLGQTAQAAILLPILRAHAEALGKTADSSPTPVQRALFTLAAKYAGYTAWISQESGDDPSADWWTGQATGLALRAGNSEMAGYAFVQRSLVSLYLDDPDQTISFARQARFDAEASARVKGHACLHEAQGHALMGSYDACLWALDDAALYLAASKGEPNSFAIGSSNVADITAMIRGWCLHDLGRPREATAVLDAEVDRIPVSALRARTRYEVRRALAYAAAGEVDHSCDLTRALLPSMRDLASATIQVDLRRLARTLNRWPTHAAVRELQPEFTRPLRCHNAESRHRRDPALQVLSM